MHKARAVFLVLVLMAGLVPFTPTAQAVPTTYNWDMDAETVGATDTRGSWVGPGANTGQTAIFRNTNPSPQGDKYLELAEGGAYYGRYIIPNGGTICGGAAGFYIQMVTQSSDGYDPWVGVPYGTGFNDLKLFTMMEGASFKTNSNAVFGVAGVGTWVDLFLYDFRCTASANLGNAYEFKIDSAVLGLSGYQAVGARDFSNISGEYAKGEMMFVTNGVGSVIAIDELRFCAAGCYPTPPPQPPTASFTESCNGLTCSFTDTSNPGSGSLTNWDWTFGDGSTSTAQNPTYAYATEGTFTVGLTVTGTSGSDTTSHSVAPTIPAPVASFSKSCTGLSCTFTDASTAQDSTVASWAWTFGDGDTSTAQNPTHAYPSPGSYTATLQVTNANAQNSNVASENFPVNFIPPSATFTGFCGGLYCDLDASGTTPGDGALTGYSWDWGDGTTTAGVTSSHTFAAPGDYTVNMTATDSNGVTDTASQAFTLDLEDSYERSTYIPLTDVQSWDFTPDRSKLVVSMNGTTAQIKAFNVASPSGDPDFVPALAAARNRACVPEGVLAYTDLVVVAGCLHTTNINSGFNPTMYHSDGVSYMPLDWGLQKPADTMPAPYGAKGFCLPNHQGYCDLQSYLLQGYNDPERPGANGYLWPSQHDENVWVVGQYSQHRHKDDATVPTLYEGGPWIKGLTQYTPSKTTAWSSFNFLLGGRTDQVRTDVSLTGTTTNTVIGVAGAVTWVGLPQGTDGWYYTDDGRNLRTMALRYSQYHPIADQRTFDDGCLQAELAGATTLYHMAMVGGTTPGLYNIAMSEGNAVMADDAFQGLPIDGSAWQDIDCAGLRGMTATTATKAYLGATALDILGLQGIGPKTADPAAVQVAVTGTAYAGSDPTGKWWAVVDGDGARVLNAGGLPVAKFDYASTAPVLDVTMDASGSKVIIVRTDGVEVWQEKVLVVDTDGDTIPDAPAIGGPRDGGNVGTVDGECNADCNNNTGAPVVVVTEPEAPEDDPNQVVDADGDGVPDTADPCNANVETCNTNTPSIGGSNPLQAPVNDDVDAQVFPGISRASVEAIPGATLTGGKVLIGVLFVIALAAALAAVMGLWGAVAGVVLGVVVAGVFTLFPVWGIVLFFAAIVAVILIKVRA